MSNRPKDPDAISRYTGSLVRRAQQKHAAVWSDRVSGDVTSVQFAALDALYKTPGINQKRLGDELDLDRSTIAELVARMVRNGLIARTHDSSDKRSYVLSLTLAGQYQRETLRPRVEEVEGVLTGALSASERKELRRLLAVMLSDG